jgi:hypothetical protein
MQQTEVPGFSKASEGVIVNTDSTALAAYKAQKEKNARLNNMEIEVNQIKNDLQEIKELLKGLVK